MPLTSDPGLQRPRRRRFTSFFPKRLVLMRDQPDGRALDLQPRLMDPVIRTISGLQVELLMKQSRLVLRPGSRFVSRASRRKIARHGSGITL